MNLFRQRMASRLVLPSDLRLAMWASVPSSPRIPLAAIMWIALLARPFPPRSSPCPSVFPLGAGMGDAPRIEASFASFGMRSGLSPAAIASPAASTVPLQHLHLQGGLAHWPR